MSEQIVSQGQTCPKCGCWHNGVHLCGMNYPLAPPQPFPIPAAGGGVQSCPFCGSLYVGSHYCAIPAVPPPAHATAAEVQSLREQVERLEGRLAELEK